MPTPSELPTDARRSPADEPMSGDPPRSERGQQSEPDASFVPVGPPLAQIRTYTLADITAILRMPGKLRLDVPDSLVTTGSGSLDLPAALPIFRQGRPTFVAKADGTAVGFVRFSPRRPDGRWIVSSIAASTGVYDPEPVWEALLAHGVRVAGLRGVRRVYARVPRDHPLVEVLRQGGWTSYAQETVFRADRLALKSSDGLDPRPQEAADTWAIHQLYAAAAPRKVQEIEALTSHVWDMDQSGRRRRRRQSGWLLERGGQLVGYARFARGTGAAMVDVVVAPGEDALFATLLDTALAGARHARRPVFYALRSYHSDFAAPLRERGFTEIGEQELLIRYTTAVARMPAHDPVVFPVELRPAMPRRVPTFLEGQPTDGTL